MKTMFNKIAMFVFALTALAVVCNTPAFAQVRYFEDQSLQITSKLPPQYLGWKVEAGSTTQTVPMYYKLTAYIPGIGETKTSPVATAYSTYAGLCSTNSLRLMWAEVTGATYYKLYRSADNTSFYYITSPTVLTYVDEGIANGAAFSAASPRGGNLTVENAITVKDLTVTGALSPYTTGVQTADALISRGDITAEDSLTVVGTSTLTGAIGAAGALDVSGAVTLNSTLDVDGNFITGAAGYRSTNTAASGAWALPATLNVIGAVTLDSTLDVDGNFITGAAGYRSTNTASSGAWAIPATLGVGGALSVTGASYFGAAATKSTAAADGTYTAVDLTSIDDVIVGDDLNVTGLATVTETLVVTGNVRFGTPAGAYVSTFTAASGNIAAGGAVSAITSVSAVTTVTAATNLITTAGFLQLYSRSEAQICAITPTVVGQVYYCNNCTVSKVAVSTGTAACEFGGFVGDFD